MSRSFPNVKNLGTEDLALSCPSRGLWDLATARELAGVTELLENIKFPTPDLRVLVPIFGFQVSGAGKKKIRG
jgi:hypothetical protein